MLQQSCFQSTEAEFLTWAAAGFYLCFVSGELFAPWLFRQFLPAYPKMPRRIYLEWNARWNSTVHAILVCACCIGALMFCPHLWENRLFSTDYFSEIIISMSSGYMIYDLLTMPMYMSGIDLLTFYVHHCVAVIGNAIIVTRRFGKFYVHYKLLTELSTPFINLRWFLRQAGVESKHPSVAITTLCFGITFILVRWIGIIPFWFMFHRSMSLVEDPVQRAVIADYSIYAYVLGLALDLLNVLWGSVIIQLCARAARDLNGHLKIKRQQKQGPISNGVERKSLDNTNGILQNGLTGSCENKEHGLVGT